MDNNPAKTNKQKNWGKEVIKKMKAYGNPAANIIQTAWGSTYLRSLTDFLYSFYPGLLFCFIYLL